MQNLKVLYGFRDFLKQGRPLSSFSAKDFFVLLALKLVLAIMYVQLFELTGIGDMDHMLDRLLEEYPLLIFVSGVTIVPFLEELVFRYPLNLKKGALLTAILLSVFFWSGAIWWIGAGYTFFLAVLFIGSCMDRPIPMKWIVYISSSFFALVHLGNFEGLDFLENLHLLPFLVLMQFIGGLMLCFVRLSGGLWWAVALHGLYNAVLLGLALIYG